MPKKFEIEVFKDAAFPWLDSDEIAHALATIEVIKPYVEIINRNRKLKLGEAHGTTELDKTKHIRVPLDSDVGVFYTGRHIIRDLHSNDKERTTGVYLNSSKLCVVSTDSKSPPRTARHEAGHAIFSKLGIVSSTAEISSEHCGVEECVMYKYIASEKRRVPSTPMCRIAESMGLRASQFQYVVTSMDFCPECSEALHKSAYTKAQLKDNEPFGRSILDGYLAQQQLTRSSTGDITS